MTVSSIWKDVLLQPHRSCLKNGGCSHSVWELTASVPLDISFLPAWFGGGACLAALLPYAVSCHPSPPSWPTCLDSLAALPHPDLASRGKPPKVVDPAHKEAEDLSGWGLWTRQPLLMCVDAGLGRMNLPAEQQPQGRTGQRAPEHSLNPNVIATTQPLI